MKYESLALQLGTPAPKFSLADSDGKKQDFDSLSGPKGTLVAFLCNHCPFVLYILDEFAKFAVEYQAKGLGIIAISSNDVAVYPEDGPEQMVQLAKERGFTFPYLYDEDQAAAVAFKAVCTPDFFLYDADGKLAYCGQFDPSRPKTEHSSGPRTELPVNGKDLRAATDAMLQGKPIPEPQFPSNGCSLKWKDGNEPEWG